MGKRIFAALLLLSLLLPYCIAGSIEAAEAEDLETVIARQIEEYAAALKGENTPTAGKNVLLWHAILGKGKDLIVDDESQLTAAFMNSVVLQECLRYSCTEMIDYMQATNLQTIYGYGGANWYKSYCSYSMNAFLNEIPIGQYGQGEYVDDVANSSTLYGMYQFDTPLNACDEAMKVVVGSSTAAMSVSRVGVGENTAVYQVTVTVYDDFDFNADYGSNELDTTLDKELAELGGSLSLWLIDPFHWESTAVFTLEVPYSCDHSYGDYQWILDPANRQLVNDTSEGLTQNGASLITDGSSEYYRLEKPVQLHYDVPWILEYEISGRAFFSMGAFNTYATASPFFDHWSNDLVLIGRWHQTLIDMIPEVNIVYESHRYGAQIKYASETGHTYTYRYENRIAEDGTNMIWVCVTDKTAAQQVVAPVPMDDYYMITNYGMTDQNSKSDWVSGKDITVRYIGNKDAHAFPEKLDIRIWSRGQENTTHNAFKDGYIRPTCTEKGGEAQVCALCGYYALTEPVGALGHSFGEYVSNEDADCVNDGTKTAECTVCGAEDTVVDEGSVYGHEFRKYKSNGDAACTSDGTKTAECKYCDVTDTVPDPGTALGHSWGNWTETMKPDAAQDGVNSRVCATCGETETETVDNNIFTDVKKDRFEDAILWAYYNSITTGTGDGTTFSPENACTRKQIVTFLWRAAGEPEPKSMVNPFADVPSDRFEKAILWAYYEGITTGTGDGTTFSPENTCTRKQIVTFLWRYNGEPQPESMEIQFEDVKNDRFAPAILWAAEQGITTGTGDGSTFSPESPCTRKQIVTFLYRDLAE